MTAEKRAYCHIGYSFGIEIALVVYATAEFEEARRKTNVETNIRQDAAAK